MNNAKKCWDKKELFGPYQDARSVARVFCIDILHINVNE